MANNFHPTGGPDDQMEDEDGEMVNPADYLFGSTSCVPCEAGKFSRPDTNAIGCIPCNSHPDFGPGYSSDPGDFICYECPVGKYVGERASCCSHPLEATHTANLRIGHELRNDRSSSPRYRNDTVLCRLTRSDAVIGL